MGRHLIFRWVLWKVISPSSPLLVAPESQSFVTKERERAKLFHFSTNEGTFLFHSATNENQRKPFEKKSSTSFNAHLLAFWQKSGNKYVPVHYLNTKIGGIFIHPAIFKKILYQLGSYCKKVTRIIPGWPDRAFWKLIPPLLDSDGWISEAPQKALGWRISLRSEDNRHLSRIVVTWNIILAREPNWYTRFFFWNWK